MPIASTEEVTIQVGGGPLLEAFAEILIRSKLHARLEAHERTGWCVLAARGNAFAKPMPLTPPPSADR